VIRLFPQNSAVIAEGHGYPGGIRLQAGSGHRFLIALVALRSRVDLEVVPDEPDPAVPLPDEVGDAGACPASVVREDRVGVDHPGGAVHEYRRDPRGDFRQQIPVIAGGGNDDQTVDAPRAEGEGQFLLALRILITRSGEKQ
jgi:hypothetical protein